MCYIKTKSSTSYRSIQPNTEQSFSANCVDCKQTNPKYLLINYGTILCNNCAKIHLELFPYSTQLKLISDSLTDDDMKVTIN